MSNELQQALESMPQQVQENYQRLHAAANQQFEIVPPSPALLERLAIVEREILAGRNPWPAQVAP